MKYSIPMLIVFLYGSLILNAQNTIEVEIFNFASDKGVVQIGLFNTETSFLDKVYKGKEVKIKDQKADAVFTDIPDGTYAILVFHDKNEDGKLNRTLNKEEATDLLWTLLSVKTWEHFRYECGWSQERYIRLMKIMAERLLVAD